MAKKRTGSRGKPPVAFLDTSILYFHSFGHSLQQSAISAMVGSSRRAASKYTFTEIKNQACQLIDFYFILEEESTVGDALKVVANHIRSRFVKTVMNLVSDELAGITNKAEALAVVANAIFGYIDKSYAYVNEIVGGELGCPLSDATLSTDHTLTTAQVFAEFRKAMSCEIDEQPKCRQGEVRQNSARVIDLIEHDAAVKNPGTRKLQAFLAKLSSGKLEHARGLRYRCSKIGDMLIALGCPEGAKIVSADGSFAELGRIIGRDVGILPSLAALMVARETKGAA